MQKVSFTVHLFKEGPTYVAHVPELDVSSCGTSLEEARKNVAGAVEGFLKTSAELGTLDEILEEAGYVRAAGGWQAPELVSHDRMTLDLG
ncbi:MAG: type II toxin-antitoxin system HicB family antitoxin [Candidatus Binataceae bacterium]